MPAAVCCCCWPPHRPSCWPWPASSSSSAKLGWLPAAGRRLRGPRPVRHAGPRHPAARPGRRLVDAIWHLMLRPLVLAIAPAIAIGRIFRAQLEAVLGTPTTSGRPASKGLPELRVLSAPRRPQLGRPGPVDGRAAARLHVRRCGGRRAGLQLARHRQLPRRRASRSPTSRRSPASPWCSARSTSSPTLVVDLLQVARRPADRPHLTPQLYRSIASPARPHHPTERDPLDPSQGDRPCST